MQGGRRKDRRKRRERGRQTNRQPAELWCYLALSHQVKFLDNQISWLTGRLSQTATPALILLGSQWAESGVFHSPTECPYINNSLLLAENPLGTAVLQLSKVMREKEIWTCSGFLRKVLSSLLWGRYKMEEDMGYSGSPRSETENVSLHPEFLHTVVFSCCAPEISVWCSCSHCQVMDPGHFR